MNSCISRIGFLLGIAAAAAAPGNLFAKADKDFDSSLAVFLSDVHVNGLDELNGKKTKTSMREHLAANVAEILRMNPLPRHVFIFGDLAHLQGRLVDYRDSLNEKDEVDAWNPTAGALSKAAQEWVLEELPKWPRPFFIGAHHPIYELKFGADGKKRLHDYIRKFPNCRGYIHGHDHIWKTNVANWREPKTVPWLTLPSNGCWGDIGYVVMRVGDSKLHGRRVAQAKFVQKDFFLGSPVAPEKRNPVWDARLEDVKGAKCTFVL